MHKNPVNSRLKLTLLAASISALSLGANAAGLGRITVLSGLGQPLRAEVEVAATPDELQNMTARLASAEAFRQAGVDYAPSINGLRMAIERRGGGAIVKVSSDRPINEPFVDMLVELNWAAGRLIREYTFLLDPPDTGAGRHAAPVIAPEVRSNFTARRVEASAPVRRQAPAGRAPRESGAAGKTYLVKPGDTLHRIAAENRPDGVSMEQMLAALFQGNRSAFDASDVNRLQAGKILRLPDAETARQLAAGGERGQIVGKSADFGRYRQKLAEQAVNAPAKEAPARQGGGGRIGAKVDDRAATAAGSTDQLKVSKSDEGRAGALGGDKSGARLQALEEDLVSRDKALKEANNRLADLEKSIRELQRLVELKSQGLAQTAEQAKPAAPALPAAPVEAASSAPATPAAAEADKPEQVKVPDPVPETKPEPPAAPAPQPVPAPPKPAEAVPPAEVSDDLSLFLGGGGILALLLGWGGYKVYQRRRAQAAPTTTSALSEFGEASNSVFGSSGGQSVDTGSSSQIQTDFSQSGLSSIDTDEGVDPVAEADVYMAYGRDAQAEEILLDALKTDPGRTGVHLKLLEIYAQRKNLKQFETTATELYSLTGGNGQDWEKAAALGRKVDPDSPLYRIPTPGAASNVIVAAPAPQTVAPAATGFGQAQTSQVQARALEPREPAPATGHDDPLESPSQLKDTWALPGELNQYASLEDIGRVAPAAAGTEASAAAPDAGMLDFDLDLNADSATGHEEVAGGGQSPTVSSLDFDLGFDHEPAPSPQTTRLAGGDRMPASLEATSTRPQRVTDDFSLPDPSDLDFEISSEFGEHKLEPASEATVNVDLTATLADEPLREEAGAATMDLEKTSFDSSLLDFDFELDEKLDDKMTATRPFDPVVNLDSIDLELPSDADTVAELPDAGPPTEPPLDLELQQEVATKLELARAYEEMGDKDGARELVEEVLREGAAVQKEEARKILARLS
ncbi:FimV/HubP family polar landmark protein [Zoogloea sp. LCSB751]|uniref:FimV/HubP family polar landmark protein n=1 Tax=Zoogloea sp. LCSB751 TaxID=1965277 RepID=UPI0020B1181E|nr:FimV/HubP family polar landmark protein [Zoogloea sp. LCSB751]